MAHMHWRWHVDLLSQKIELRLGVMTSRKKASLIDKLRESLHLFSKSKNMEYSKENAIILYKIIVNMKIVFFLEYVYHCKKNNLRLLVLLNRCKLSCFVGFRCLNL